MYYLRLQSYQIKNAIGKTFETGDRAIYKHKKYNRFYRNFYPIPDSTSTK
ncbi:hypothetical protein [Anaerosalibacter sp. Marseille-P3206]|nr:hypothetical protein [Anaerosalibacter sp. Marseille-P3206]